MSTTKEEKSEENKEKEHNTSSWEDFIYNLRTGELLGRTAGSWGLILLFYLVFYGFLAAMFCLTMWLMLLTLDDNTPRYRDRIPSPGLVMRPHALDISYNRNQPIQFQYYIDQLENFLQQYDDSIQEQNEPCQRGEYTEQRSQGDKKVCQFKRSLLRRCSGLSDTSFGYAEGKPCILLKLNRIIGLKPRGDPYINCTAKGDNRHNHIDIHYFPPEGRIDKMYFPYYGKKAHANYVQPLVAVKLLLAREDYGVEHTLECRVEGSDLPNRDDRDKFLGRITFRVKVFD